MGDQETQSQGIEKTEVSESVSITQNSKPTVNKPWQFQPGQSGNPGGRPKKLTNHLDKLLDQPYNKEDTYSQALVKSILKRAITRSFADANLIWERAEGKVPQAITGPDGGSPFQVAIVFGSQETEPETQEITDVEAQVIENNKDAS